ncbi:hypothetical protein DER30_1953 [Streptomyces sp. HB202]|nr:hypothetical protein DER30_1953 [Streptomyces sp. HB202]
MRPAAVEADDPVGGQVGAVGGDGVEQGGAAGSGLAGEADAAAARQQADQALALLLALQERQLRGGRTGGHGGCAGAFVVGAFGGGAADRGVGPRAGRNRLDLTAVDGVDREQQVARGQLDDADLLRCLRAEVGAAGVPGRPSVAGLAAGAVVALPVLIGCPVCRVHRKVPQTRRARLPLPASHAPRCRFRSGVRHGFVVIRRTAEP